MGDYFFPHFFSHVILVECDSVIANIQHQTAPKRQTSLPLAGSRTRDAQAAQGGFLPNTKLMQHSCSHYNAFRSITSQTCTCLRAWQHQMTTIIQPFQCDMQPQIPKHPITTHAQAHPKQLEATTTSRKNQGQTDRSRNRRTDEVPFIARAATSHGKTQGFVLRLPPQHKAHATFMQPSQCVSQHHVANLHLSTHMATPDDNNHAAIPMRSATTDSKTPYNYARQEMHVHVASSVYI